MSENKKLPVDLGKKIFFLFPTSSMQNQIINELAQNEYEVYVSKDQARLLRALKKFPDSIVFVNIDEGMPAHEWDRWVGAFHTAMPEIKIGVFSSSTDEEVRDRYINKHKISCGFFNLKVDMSKAVNIILDILNTLNAKGRRKYLRASTDNETTAGINLPSNGEYINGSIKDISVVGFACVLETDPGFKKNELIKNIQLKLQSMLLKVEAVVFGSRTEQDQKVYVMIFTQRIDPDIKVKIRKYIQASLQAKIDV